MGESAVANDAADVLGGERMFVDYAGQTGRTRRRPAMARSDGRRLRRCDGRIQLPFTPCELDADPSGLDRLASLRWLSWCAVPCLIDRHRARPVLSYRACEFAAGVGGWPTIIGGLSIPYATIPMNKRTGMTIGGTRYFMALTGELDGRQQSASFFGRCRRTGQGA